jgi:hypothetical protein
MIVLIWFITSKSNKRNRTPNRTRGAKHHVKQEEQSNSFKQEEHKTTR